MAVTHKLYGPAMKNILNGNIGALDSTTTVIKVALMSSAHTFTQTHETFSQIIANEISSVTNDYTSGGEILTPISVSSVGNVTTVDHSTSPKDTVFTSTGSITAFHAVLYVYSTSGPTASYLLSSIDLDGERKSVAGTFKLTWASGGIYTITAAT